MNLSNFFLYLFVRDSRRADPQLKLSDRGALFWFRKNLSELVHILLNRLYFVADLLNCVVLPVEVHLNVVFVRVKLVMGLVADTDVFLNNLCRFLLALLLGSHLNIVGLSHIIGHFRLRAELSWLFSSIKIYLKHQLLFQLIVLSHHLFFFSLPLPCLKNQFWLWFRAYNLLFMLLV